MADKTRILVWVCCTLLLAGGCRMQEDKQIKLYFKPGLVTFVDSTEASVAIIKDDSENFFQNLSETEVMIQMKRSEPFNSREEAQKAFAQWTALATSTWRWKASQMELVSFPMHRMSYAEKWILSVWNRRPQPCVGAIAQRRVLVPRVVYSGVMNRVRGHHCRIHLPGCGFKLSHN